MAIIGVPTINAPGIPEDTSRARPVRDPALVGVSDGGVRFLADAAFPWCYPGGSPTGRPDAGDPADGAVIYEMNERVDGSFINPAGGVTYAGGGFDFTNSLALTGSRNVGIVMPAAVLADIWTAWEGNSQQYLFEGWFKLPSLANWNASTSLLSIAGDLSYLTGASLFILTMKSGGTIEVRRQTSAGNYDVTNVMTLTPASGDYGSVVQIGVWRNASGQGLRLRSANGTVLVSKAVGSDNTQNFSANPFIVGRNGASFPGASPTTTLTALSGFRVYRAMMENLARSGRNPTTVLDAAYTAVAARGVFS
jgi:hypothetical protein